MVSSKSRKRMPSTDLGTDEIHKRHRVLIAGGNVPQARVMDQTMIDRYLMQGLLTLAQHQAGEYILRQAVKAGMYTPPLNYSAPTGTGEPSGPREAILTFGRTMAIIRRRYGEYASYLVEEVVCHGWDVSSDKDKMRVLRDGLDIITQRKMIGNRNPLRHMKKSGG